MKYASVCSGVEAASLAWMPLGWEAAWFSEIEPFPCAVLKERFPDVPNLGDMTKIKVENLPNGDQRFTNENGTDVIIPGGVDLLVGGTPCQGFSVAGTQAGISGDPRSALCLSYVDHLKSMRPRWFVWENVPGVFSTNGGEDFKEFIRKIDEIGYSVAWRVLDDQYVRVDGFPRAVPQRRRRVFVVGYFGDWRYPAQVLFNGEMCGGDTPPSRTKRQRFAACTESCIDTASTIRMRSGHGCGGRGALIGDNLSHTLATGNDQTIVTFQDGTKWRDGTDTAGTLTTTSNNQLMPDKARLQCVVEEPECLDMRQIEVHEKGVSPTLIATDYKGGKAVCFQQNSRDEVRLMSGDGEVAGAICAVMATKQQNYLCYENHPQDCRLKEVDVGQTVVARCGTGGNNGQIVQEIEEEPVGFIKNDAGGEQQGYWTGVMGVAYSATVRRLLPVECERLMGFPDNWTRIPWRGKSADGCPDVPRYKACGNSMCVNVMRWIGMRIELLERRTRTKNE